MKKLSIFLVLILLLTSCRSDIDTSLSDNKANEGATTTMISATTIPMPTTVVTTTPAETTIVTPTTVATTMPVETAIVTPQPVVTTVPVETTIATSTTVVTTTSMAVPEVLPSEQLPHPEIPSNVVRYCKSDIIYGVFYYFAVDVVVEKIYYDDLTDKNLNVGEVIRVLFPCHRYADIMEADELILNFDDESEEYGIWGADASNDYFDKPIDFYYAYHTWDADSIFFIDNGKLSQLSMPDDYSFSYLLAEHWRDFYYGMSDVNVDSFIMEQRAIDLAEKDFAPPDGMEIEYGMSAFMFVDGLRCKCAVLSAYTND